MANAAPAFPAIGPVTDAAAPMPLDRSMTLRQTAYVALRDGIRDTLQARANERFRALFAESAPQELAKRAPNLSDDQRRQIVQETLHLFQRPLEDPWMVARMQEAKLPVERILGDYNQRLQTLNGMASQKFTEVTRTLKRVGATLGIALLGGVASLWGSNRLLRKSFAELSRWVRYPLAAAGGFLGSGLAFKIGAHLLPVADDPKSVFDQRQMDAQLAVHSGFAGEIMRMTATAYAVRRAAGMCSVTTAHPTLADPALADPALAAPTIVSLAAAAPEPTSSGFLQRMTDHAAKAAPEAAPARGANR